MGQVTSNISSYIEEQFDLLLAAGKHKEEGYLTVDEILGFKSLSDFPMDFRHIGVLFCIDKDKTGLFTREDLLDFAQFLASIPGLEKSYDFKGDVRSLCSMELWK